MQKQLCLDLDSLMEEYPTSEYDFGGLRREITIDVKDKAAFIKEITAQFRERVKESLELEYVCDSCENVHTDLERIFKCKKCKTEICGCCFEVDCFGDGGICRDCFSGK
jgi:hypothetical protein